MFGVKHIIILICTVAVIVGMVFCTKKRSLAKKAKVFMLIGLVFETIKVFFYIIANEETHGGVLPKTDLPFQLCSIQIIFILLVCFSKSERVKRTLLAFMFPSGLIGGAAILLWFILLDCHGARFPRPLQ